MAKTGQQETVNVLVQSHLEHREYYLITVDQQLLEFVQISQRPYHGLPVFLWVSVLEVMKVGLLFIFGIKWLEEGVLLGLKLVLGRQVCGFRVGIRL